MAKCSIPFSDLLIQNSSICWFFSDCCYIIRCLSSCINFIYCLSEFVSSVDTCYLPSSCYSATSKNFFIFFELLFLLIYPVEDFAAVSLSSYLFSEIALISSLIFSFCLFGFSFIFFVLSGLFSYDLCGFFSSVFYQSKFVCSSFISSSIYV